MCSIYIYIVQYVSPHWVTEPDGLPDKPSTGFNWAAFTLACQTLQAGKSHTWRFSWENHRYSSING